MDYKFFLYGVKDIIINPSKAWETIDIENKSVKIVRDNFLLPLILLVAISDFAGSLLFINTELSPVYSIFVGIRSFILLFCTINITSFILGEVTFPLDLGKDFHVSFRIMTFSFVPFMICQMLSGVFESLLFVNIIGLYGLYIFWAGSEKFLDPPSYKKMPLLIATVMTTILVYVTANILLKTLLDRIYYAFFE